MKQFILTEEPDKNSTVRLKGNDYHYLVRVRRLASGEFFPALLPNGEETLVQILSIDKNVLTAKCQTSLEAASLEVASEKKLPSLILFQALPKGDKMDLIVRQAAEGGITEIVPFVSEFSVAKTAADGQKYARWERIIREARQQSGSKIATAIRRPENGKSLTISGLFEYWAKLRESGALGLFFHQEGLEKESLHSYLSNIGSVAAMAIGPEGGFSDAEASLFLENGFKPVTIGDAVLRTETAALYCAAAVKILLLERDSWELKQVKKSCGLTC
jgi:16S rRNA (uracil1498-N3)-methyltransferase